MKGLLFFDIYRSILLYVNPYTQCKLSLLTKKLFSNFKVVDFKTTNYYLRESSFHGLLIPTLFFIDKSFRLVKLFDALEYAAQSNHKRLSIWLIESGAKDFDIAFANAALGGHIDFCKFLVRSHLWRKCYGGKNFNWALSNAASGGHIVACRFFMQAGAKNLNWALSCAAQAGHIDICNCLIDAGANAFEWAIENSKDAKTKEYLNGFLFSNR